MSLLQAPATSALVQTESPCRVSDTAAMHVLHQEHAELRRVPIELSGDEVRVIVP